MKERVIFILDTSLSMCQRDESGMKYIDLAKTAISTLAADKIKKTEHTQFMLISTASDPKKCILSGWDNDYAGFKKALSQVKLGGINDLNAGFSHGLLLANQSRFKDHVDTYGKGRYISQCEPCYIVLLSDGGVSMNQHHQWVHKISLPPIHIDGNDLTIEPFRWDIRMFSMLIQCVRSPAHDTVGDHSEVLSTNNEKLSPLYRDIAALSEVTEGTTWVNRRAKGVMKSIEVISNQMQAGVVVKFSVRVEGEELVSGGFIFARAKALLSFPIPEDYLPIDKFKARSAHPLIHLTFVESLAQLEPEFNFPFHSVHINRSVANKMISSQTFNQKGDFFWRLSMKGSDGIPDQMGQEFGLLRFVKEKNTFIIVILPYRYLLLNDIIRRYKKDTKLSHLQEEIRGYMKSIPYYYHKHIKAFITQSVVSLPLSYWDEVCRDMPMNLSKVIDKCTDRFYTQVEEYFHEAPAPSTHPNEHDIYLSPAYSKANLMNQVGYYTHVVFQGAAKEKKQEILQGTNTVPIATMGDFDKVVAKAEKRKLRSIEDRVEMMNFGNPYALKKNRKNLYPYKGADEVDDKGRKVSDPRELSSPQKKAVSLNIDQISFS